MPPRRPTPPPPTVPSEDHRKRLTALRDRLTTELETAPPAYVAALARQLQAVLGELAGLRDPAATSALDALVARRANRQGQAGER